MLYYSSQACAPAARQLRQDLPSLFYVRVYICIYAYIHINIYYVCIYICIYIYIYMCVLTRFSPASGPEQCLYRKGATGIRIRSYPASGTTTQVTPPRACLLGLRCRSNGFRYRPRREARRLRLSDKMPRGCKSPPIVSRR